MISQTADEYLIERKKYLWFSERFGASAPSGHPLDLVHSFMAQLPRL